MMEFGEYGQILSNNTVKGNFKIPRTPKYTDKEDVLDQQASPVNMDYAQYYKKGRTSLASGLPGLWGNPIEPPPPPPIESCNTANNDIAKQKEALFITTLKRKLDEDTTPRFKSAYTELLDPGLPKELTSLFQPLYCKLCETKCSSSINAKLHYNGKNHDKRVRNWLIDYSKKTGEPLHKRAMNKGDSQNEALNPRYSYCQVCDLKFTSKAHAESHYMGRAHQKAISGHTPSGSGYYDENGQWRRMVTPNVDTTGRDGIGVAFAKPEEFRPQQKTKFFCDICSVNCTNADQLRMHLEGQKHVKKVRNANNQQVQQAMAASAAAASIAAATMAQGQKDLVYLQQQQHQALAVQQTQPLGVIAAPPPPGTVAPHMQVAMPPDNILNSVLATDESVYRRDNPDLSVYRTPSGDFYCQLCNNTISVETQFRQHLFSKKHMRKELAQKGVETPS